MPQSVQRRNPTLKAFGERLRHHRLAAGLSQDGLAKKAGIHRTYVGSAERGERNVALVNILKLAKVLGVDASVLVSGLKPPKRK